VRVAVVAVGPQRVTDHCDRLTGIVFLRGKDTAEDRLNAERRKHFRIQARRALICSGCTPPESSNDVVI